MSETVHPWCRDTARDEAIRAAEDAASAKRTPLPDHRDLPAAVAELRERVERLEQCATAGLLDRLGDSLPADVTTPREAAPVSRKCVSADGLRTERVTLEIAQRAESYAPCRDLDWHRILRQAPGGLFPGESVRVVEEATMPEDTAREMRAIVRMRDPEVARLTAERDAALRERDAARADAEHDVREVLAFARLERDAAKEECERLRESARGEIADNVRLRQQTHELRARVAKLESAAKLAPAANAGGEANCPAAPDSSPQPPRGWLTEEERTAVKAAVIFFDQHGRTNLGVALDAILARKTPPKVKVPPLFNAKERNAVVAAIREAGGEVE